MATMSRAEEILGERESAFIQTAVREHRMLAAQRMRFLLQHFSAQEGLVKWKERLLAEVVTRVARVEDCTPEEVRTEIEGAIAGQADPITFLEQLTITVRTDREHRVLYVD